MRTHRLNTLLISLVKVVKKKKNIDYIHSIFVSEHFFRQIYCGYTGDICAFQFTSLDRSNFLIFLLNELKLSALPGFLGSLNQMRSLEYFIECVPYRNYSIVSR